MAQETGLAYEPPRSGAAVRGVYRRRVDLASGRYAMIATDEKAFSLVPWRRELDRELGREVSAMVRGRDVA